MDRRTFLAQLGRTLVLVPVSSLPLGCKEQDSTAPEKSFTIDSSTDAGHAHSLTLTCSEMKGNVLSYISSNSSGHTHVVSLTFNELTRVLNNESVTLTTSSGGHPHTWTLLMPANLCSGI